MSAAWVPDASAPDASVSAPLRALTRAPGQRLLAALLPAALLLGLVQAAHAAAQAVELTQQTVPGTAPETAPQAPVRISNAWIRWLPSQLPAAGYMILENTGERPLDLVAIASPDYADVMLHRTMHNGATTMMEMTPALALPPHKKVAIAPGGYHLMLEKPTRAIAPGATVQLELHFSDGATVRTAVPVSAPTRTQ